MLFSAAIITAEYAIYLSAIIFVCVLFTDKVRNKKHLWTLAVISWPLMYLAQIIVGFFYNDPRPFVVGHFIPPVLYVINNGFPSGHTLFCAALAAVMYPYHKGWGTTLWVITLAVGLSRVVVGVHHAVDVIGSILLAFLVVYFVRKSKVADVLYSSVSQK